MSPPSPPLAPVSILDFPGAYFNTQISSQASLNTSVSRTQLTVRDASFSTADAGKTIIVTDGGATTVSLITTIAAVVDSTQVTLTSSYPGTTFNYGQVAWGTDDSEGYANALAFLYSNYLNGGGTLLLPPGISLVTSPTVFGTTDSPLTNSWSLAIFGQGIGATTVLVANADGWIQINNSTFTPQCSIRDFSVLACMDGAGKAFGWDMTTVGGDNVQTFWLDHVLLDNFNATVGYFDFGLSCIGATRPDFRDLFLNALAGANVPLLQALNDDSPGYATTIGVIVDGCYTPKFTDCNVWNCTRGIQHIVPSNVQGIDFINSQAVNCREGFWVESPDVEPGLSMVGGHLNCRDVGLVIFQKKLCAVKGGTLLYNTYLVPGTDSTPGPTTMTTGISSSTASTVTLTNVENWNPNGGMLTIDDECMTYESYTGTTLQSLTRGAYGTIAVAHTNTESPVYGNTMTATTATVDTGAINPGTTIQVVNTAGMPRIGAVLLEVEVEVDDEMILMLEWWTYDNQHQAIYATGTVTCGTYTITFTWKGDLYITAPIEYYASWSTIAAALQTAAPLMPGNQVIVSAVGLSSTLPAAPQKVTAMFGITSVSPLVIIGIDSADLMGGSYQVSSLNSTTVASESNDVDVTDFTGSETLYVTSVAAFLPSSYGQSELIVATSSGVATLTYKSISGSTFTDVNYVSGSGTLETGGSVVQQAFQNNLCNLSRAAFGTEDPGVDYEAPTMVTAGVADILVAGGSYGISVDDAQIHYEGHQFRKSLQIQDYAHDVTHTDSYNHQQGGWATAIDGTSQGCQIGPNKYSAWNVLAAVTPLLNGASDTLYTPPAAGTTYKITASNSAWPIPNGGLGINVLEVVAVGGGGGGGGGGTASSSSTAQTGGGGGGSGEVVAQLVSVGSNTTLNIEIGSGGTRGHGGTSSSGSTSGNHGASTTVTGTDISVTATGGSGALGSGANSTATAEGGMMGVQGDGANVNVNTVTVGGGGPSNLGGGGGVSYGGGGGGGGGPATAGSTGGSGGDAGTQHQGGAAASVAGSGLNGGGGGSPPTNADAGNNTGAGGGGGGGGAANSMGMIGTGGSGGNGGSGYVVIRIVG